MTNLNSSSSMQLLYALSNNVDFVKFVLSFFLQQMFIKIYSSTNITQNQKYLIRYKI